MSRGFEFATEIGTNYLNLPLDDLESCFSVAFWSALFNRDQEGLLSIQERAARESLAKANKDKAAGSFYLHWPHKKLANVMQRFRPTLAACGKRYSTRVGRGGMRFWTMRRRVWVRNTTYRNFHRFALQGVVDILEVTSERWDGEFGWENWETPVLPVTSRYETFGNDTRIISIQPDPTLPSNQKNGESEAMGFESLKSRL